MLAKYALCPFSRKGPKARASSPVPGRSTLRTSKFEVRKASHGQRAITSLREYAAGALCHFGDGNTYLFAWRYRPLVAGLGRPRWSADGEMRPLIATAFNEWSASLSTDDRFLAYASNATGRDEVYVTPYSTLERTVPISTEDGRWFGAALVTRWTRSLLSDWF